MKRAVLWSAALMTAFALTGCPVYPDDRRGCFDDEDCAPGYACDHATGACFLPGGGGSGGGSASCSAPDDCRLNETCDKSGVCQTGSCHVDSVGCVSGYSCEIVDGTWTCVASSSSGGAAGASGAAGAGGADAGTSTGGSGGEASSDGGDDEGGGGAAADGGLAEGGSAAAAGATGDASSD
jgi:hypothetical protein